MPELGKLKKSYEEPEEDDDFLRLLWGEEDAVVIASPSSSPASSVAQDMSEDEAEGMLNAPQSPPGAQPPPLALAALDDEAEGTLNAPQSPPGAQPPPLALAALDNEAEAEGTLNAPQSPPGAQPPPLALAALDNEAEGTLNAPQSPPGAQPPPLALAALDEEEAEEAQNPPEEAEEAQNPPEAVLHERIADLVEFLLLKYRSREPTTKAEMLQEVLDGDQEHFSLALHQARDCLQLIFGLEVQEVEPDGDSYVMVTSLGLTYDGLSPEHSMPRTGLLLIVLALIALESDCASEAHMWESLGVIGLHAGSQHFIFGEPRELLTELWVQEQYLEYRPVPGTDPTCYEFLWGPRAHAETNKEDVLEYLLNVNKDEARLYLTWFQESDDEDVEVEKA